ncbi:potassium-transporting ATPase subunit KdpC [Pseudoduganella eburnea]|uniref:Potassium-transporting ATPase KdpC subunit n=1 Tax=Massilia eburnea TaxID=1776165 RepID=A0A6L6QF03_9BURK|nr:potassium-transporting ATPase subunit KdpC [Massilia eburnea]MTW10253.1 potassium-transporting ATPase subunit KdpC [Massilia eburnea]
MISTFRPALVLFGALTLATGVLYPLAVTGVGQALFPHQAAGSIIEVDGKAVGSALIGQQFTSPEYFWSRPSATGPMPYNASGSSASNLGPLNPALTDAVKARVDALKAADPANTAPVPVDLVTASGSGLDPEISLAAANYQVKRVAAQRGMLPEYVQKLIEQHASHRMLGIFGEPRVNVLALNLALDGKTPHTR